MTTMPEHLNMDWVECVKVRVMVLFGNDMIMNSWLVDEQLDIGRKMYTQLKGEDFIVC